jgi:hypothetical protein
MVNILEDLPDKKQLTKLLDGKFSPDMLGVGDPKDLDARGLGDEISKSIPADGVAGLPVPDIPASLSREAFMAGLRGPLDRIKSINATSLVGEITAGALPVSLEPPDFDISSIMGGITAAVVPVRLPAPKLDLAIPGLDPQAFVDPLRKLAEAGAATPMRLLSIMMNTVRRLAAAVSDPDKLIEFTEQSFREIYASQVQILRHQIPLIVLEETQTILEKGITAGSFLNHYKSLLDEIEILSDTTPDRIQKILMEARETVLPPLRTIAETKTTLENLKDNVTEPLRDTLQTVVDFTSVEEVFLQKFFHRVESGAGQILDGIVEPVNQLTEMAQKIEAYLNRAADTAQETAEAVSDSLETHIKKLVDFLTEVQAKIEEIEKQIQAFLDKLNVAPSVNQIKQGCNQIGEGIELFLTKVEEIKQKLDETIVKVQVRVDEKMTQVFNELEGEIRELLGKITQVLDREEVKEALSKAQQGIEEFKTAMDEASLQPVFDLVVGKTGELEGSIRRIDVSRLGTPQRTALNVGAKVIQEVKVDEIVKPELMDAFNQIRDPLLELFRLLKDKVQEIEQLIYDFNPAAVAHDSILNSVPYQQIIGTLEGFRPSVLLAPLKEANTELTKIVARLDPQIIIDELQKIYDRLADLLDVLSPAHLNRHINDAVDVAVLQLEQVRDRELETIVTTIKETISLEKLMAHTGIQEITEADFWQMLGDILDGKLLGSITAAMDEVQGKLAEPAGTLDFSDPMRQLKAVVQGVGNQLIVDATIIFKRVNSLDTMLKAAENNVMQLQARRRKLLATYRDAPELGTLIKEIDLNPLVELGAIVQEVAALEQTQMDGALDALNGELQNKVNGLKAVAESTLQEALPQIFQRQFADPARELIHALQTKLQPFQDAVAAVQSILTTLVAIPERIDQSVASVLDTLKNSIRDVINNTLGTLASFRESLTGILDAVYERAEKVVNDLSPYWILNCFAVSDFAGAATNGTPRGMQAMAQRIHTPAAEDPIAALLQTKLTAEKLALLAKESGDALQEGSRNNVLEAFNLVLEDDKLCSAEIRAATKTKLQEHKGALEKKLKGEMQGASGDAAGKHPELTPEQRQASIESIKTLYRCMALLNQLTAAQAAYDGAAVKKNPRIRLNRVLLEANYPDDIAPSLPSLHPYILEQITHLYPGQTVQRLDDMYVGVIEKVKELPDRMIRAPLDDAFQKIKDTLNANFDISGIFNVLETKMKGMDRDLSEGLDRLSLAYNRLLTALDERLAA